MAEDIRQPDSKIHMIERRREEIRKEFERQEESCLYTATTFFLWLRIVRRQKQFFVAAPIILGGIAGVSVLKAFLPDWSIALLALSASILPALADALKIETSVDELSRAASEYKILQGRFRIAANFSTIEDIDKAERTLNELTDRMDTIRSTSLTPPEKYFLEARRKIHSGHYTHAVDEGKHTAKPEASDSPSSPVECAEQARIDDRSRILLLIIAVLAAVIAVLGYKTYDANHNLKGAQESPTITVPAEKK